MLVRMWRNQNPCALLAELQNSAAIIENSMEVPQKIFLKNHQTIQQPDCWIYIQNNWKQSPQEVFTHPWSLQQYSQ